MIYLLALIAAAVGASDLVEGGPGWLWLLCVVLVLPAFFLVIRDYWEDTRTPLASIEHMCAEDATLRRLRDANPVPTRRGGAA